MSFEEIGCMFAHEESRFVNLVRCVVKSFVATCTQHRKTKLRGDQKCGAIMKWNHQAYSKHLLQRKLMIVRIVLTNQSVLNAL